MKLSTILLIVIPVLLIVVPLVSADSYKLLCLEKGEFLDLPNLCNPAMEPRTGPITICMHFLDSGSICPTLFNRCNQGSTSCTSLANSTIDKSAPSMQINSPQNNAIYTQRSINVDVDPSEISEIYYIDLNDPSARWRQICSRCSGYNRSKSFVEGPNDIMFRVKDVANNADYFNVSFFVDSRNPRIRSVSPTRGFTNGMFEINIDELNPKLLEVVYGNQTGTTRHQVDIESDCILERTTYKCKSQVNLDAYDEQEVTYHVELTDISNNYAESRTYELDVDFTPPRINIINYTINGKYVTFYLNVTEKYFDKIAYIDNLNSRARERTLCTRLKDDICEKRITFSDGNHEVDIVVYDEAGNNALESFQFFTDSRAPNIRSVEPRRGFTSGEFYIKFQEENPKVLEIIYGNDFEGFRTHEINIPASCTLRRTTYECTAFVNVALFNNQDFQYHIRLTDKVFSIDESRPTSLEVDTIFPVINKITHTVLGSTATIFVNLTETNFDQVTYYNYNDGRPTERRLCSRLSNGICEGRISRLKGTNSIDISVYDEAGNAVGINYIISV